MPFTHTVTDAYVHIQWHGELNKEDFGQIGALLPRIAATLRRAPHVLHTFDAVTGAKLQPLDAFHHSLRLQDAPITTKARSAAVAKTPEIRAMAKLLCELNRHPNLTMEIFSSDKKAIAWLGAADQPSPVPRRRPRQASAD